MLRHKLALLLALAAAMTAVVSVEAGEVVLKDGRTLKGTVVVKEKIVTVNGPDGLFQFKEDQVESIKKEDAPAPVTAAATVTATAAAAAAPAGDKGKLPVVTLVTSMGKMTCELFEDDAPNTVANFISLCEKNFYDGTKFHRVIKNFMLQGGDPNSKGKDTSKYGSGGPDYSFEDEISSRKNLRYALSMANSGPNTNGSQFFVITKVDGTDWLDGKHAVFGRVIQGEEVADAIEGVETIKVDNGQQVDRPAKDVVLQKTIIDYKRNHPYEPKVIRK